MKIAQLAPLAEAVPPKGYGGTELVVSQLTEELVRRNHDVVLYATGDSETAAELVSIAPRGLRMDGVPSHRWVAYEMRSLIRFLERKDEFDIVHNHMGFLALPFLENVKCPVVSTIHNPILEHSADIYRAYKHNPLIAISDAFQRLNLPDELNYVGRVYNAVDAEGFSPEPETYANVKTVADDPSRKYLLFLGRVSHAKGTAEAIKIARSVGMPLKIAGKVDSTDDGYYKQKVEPELHSGIEYVGEVGFREKQELYKNALAIVYPINFEEPFGLVMVEGLAAGTPLVALDRGSVREILTEKTSVVGSSVDELISRFDEVKQKNSADCIERAKEFSVEKMTSGYEEIYNRVLGLKDSRGAVLAGQR